MNAHEQHAFIAELTELARELDGPITPEQQAIVRQALADQQKEIGTFERCEPSTVQAGAVDFIFRRADGAISRLPVPFDKTDDTLRDIMLVKTLEHIAMRGLTPGGTA